MTLKAYALLEYDKKDECLSCLADISPTTMTDPVIVKLLVLTLIKLGMVAECTKMLEGSQAAHPTRVDVNEQLFFAYVRENKLLKQQNQALHLYKITDKDLYAQWAV